jgi:hypothetical protein
MGQTLERLLKLGGLALVAGLAGLLLTVVAGLKAHAIQVPLFVAGCALTFFCLACLVIVAVRVRDIIGRASSSLSSVADLQQIALQLTELASATQAAASKHLSAVQRGVETLLPVIDRVPVIAAALRSSGLADAARMSAAKIVAITEGTADTIRELDGAIRRGDLKELQRYGAKLSFAIQRLRAMLAA